MRRVNFVRVIVEVDRVRAEAVGIRYRLPAVMPITLARAAELARSGVPVVIRRKAAVA